VNVHVRSNVGVVKALIEEGSGLRCGEGTSLCLMGDSWLEEACGSEAEDGGESEDGKNEADHFVILFFKLIA